MNQIVTTNVSPTAGQPLVANAGDGSIPFLQRGVMESMWNMLVGILGGYTTNDVIILEGFIITLSNSNNTATWTAGRVGYNGEIYTVDSGTLTKTGGQTFLYSIAVTNHPTLDPVLFDDNTSNNVHNIRKVTITKGASGGGIADYGAATIKMLNGATNTGFSIQSSSNLTSPFIAVQTARKRGGEITYSIFIGATVTAGASGYSITIDCPIGFKMKPSSSYGGTNISTGILARRLTTNATLVIADNGLDFSAGINTNNRLVIADVSGIATTSESLTLTLDFKGDAL